MRRPVPLPSATGSPSTRLPSVLTPGTHTTRDGITEVSCASFAKAVLDAIPPDALLFRMGEAVGRIHGPPGAGRFRELDPDTTRLLVDRHVRLVASRRDGRSRGPRLEFQPCTKDLAGLVLAAARTSPCVRTLTALVNYPV